MITANGAGKVAAELKARRCRLLRQVKRTKRDLRVKGMRHDGDASAKLSALVLCRSAAEPGKKRTEGGRTEERRGREARKDGEKRGNGG